MTLSTWQLVVVGGLLAAWVIVLGGPAVVDAYRWFNGRSRRRHARQTKPTRSIANPDPGAESDDGRGAVEPSGQEAPTGDAGLVRRARSDGHEPTGDHPGPIERLQMWWWDRPHPLAAWRAQDVVHRRIQLLLGLSVATFSSMFLAIALRGVFVRLFLLMLGVMAISLTVAAYIGAVELRHHRAQSDARRATEERPRRILDDTAASESILGPDQAGPMTMADEGFRQTDRNEPGLIFEPLNLDEIVFELGRNRHGTDWGEEIWLDNTGFDVPIDPELARELGLEGSGEQIESGPTAEGESTLDAHQPSTGGVEDELDQSGDGQDATFTAAPEAGARQASARARSKKRRQARPIYIESTLDDEENQWKAANDQ